MISVIESVICPFDKVDKCQKTELEINDLFVYSLICFSLPALEFITFNTRVTVTIISFPRVVLQMALSL